MSEQTFEAFKRNSASSSLGWEPHPSMLEGQNCLKQTWVAHVGENRVRSNGQGDNRPQSVEVVVAGGSYTFGDEVNDSETYPAQLENMLENGVANLGVGGYGPVQSVLRIEKYLDQYETAKVAMLSIMYENLFRMPNSYRPVYLAETGLLYGLKPYAAGDKIYRLVSDPWRDFKSFKSEAEIAFDHDFWASPVFAFPYSFSFARAFASNKFYFFTLHGFGERFLGWPKRRGMTRSQEIQTSLSAVLDYFARMSEERGIYPVVVLIPQNSEDISSIAMMSEMFANLAPAGMTVISVGEDIDWSRYNLRPDGRCHPSPYGYGAIAAEVAPVLQGLLKPDASQAGIWRLH